MKRFDFNKETFTQLVEETGVKDYTLRWYWDDVILEDQNGKEITVRVERGCSIDFANNISLSVVWRYKGETGRIYGDFSTAHSAATCEIGARNYDLNWVYIPGIIDRGCGNQVKGWVTPSELKSAIVICAGITNPEIMSDYVSEI